MRVWRLLFLQEKNLYIYRYWFFSAKQQPAFTHETAPSEPYWILNTTVVIGYLIWVTISLLCLNLKYIPVVPMSFRGMLLKSSYIGYLNVESVFFNGFGVDPSNYLMALNGTQSFAQLIIHTLDLQTKVVSGLLKIMSCLHWFHRMKNYLKAPA